MSSADQTCWMNESFVIGYGALRLTTTVNCKYCLLLKTSQEKRDSFVLKRTYKIIFLFISSVFCVVHGNTWFRRQNNRRNRANPRPIYLFDNQMYLKTLDESPAVFSKSNLIRAPRNEVVVILLVVKAKQNLPIN